jgi:diguanylate cyclase (GGDEF)-like protein
MGDEALRHAAAVVRENLRQDDLAFRYGGEEIVVLCPETDAAGAAALSERMRATLAGSSVQPGIDVTASFGVVELIGAGLAAEFLAAADHALALAKSAGRNRVQVGSMASKAGSPSGAEIRTG